MNKNYVKGCRLEYDVMKILRATYPVVMRTAGSHGLFDVIAVSCDKTLFVQVKSNLGDSMSALREIESAGLDATNVYQVWYKPSRGIWECLTACCTKNT